MTRLQRLLLTALSFGALLSLQGCDTIELLNPAGIVARDETKLLIVATVSMLFVVIPVIALTLFVTWRYRESNKKATYDPSFTDSTLLEIIWWTIPCIIIAILGTLTWKTTHSLDPYRSLDNKKPLVIQAISLDWKWLFIYPEQHIAVVNHMVIPEQQSVKLLITADGEHDAPMNGIQIDQLAGQIYSMAGMQTQLHLKADHTGRYRGTATNYSGDGFAGMHFVTDVKDKAGFAAWVQKTQAVQDTLDQASYQQLLKPSEHNPVHYYGHTAKNLYSNILAKYQAK